MGEEVFIFWSIHLFIGILLPTLAYFGCCQREADQDLKKAKRLQEAIISHR